MARLFGGSIRFKTAALRSGEYPKSSSYPAHLRNRGKVEQRTTSLTQGDSIAFRIAGEAFAAIPTLQSVLVSGFSQRQSRATGRVEEEYLYSVRIDRTGWERIDFSSLDVIDPSDALAQFDLRRNMTRAGVFLPLIPIS